MRYRAVRDRRPAKSQRAASAVSRPYLSLSGQRNRVTPVDDLVAIDRVLQHALGFVPGDLMEDVPEIEPTLTLEVRNGSAQLFGTLTDIFGNDRQDLGCS